MKRFLAVVAVTGLACGAARAEPAKTLTVTKSVDVAAPVDKAWAAVKDFDSLPKWHPGFSSDELVSGKNNTVGAERKLTVKDGPSFTEKLLAFDDATHSYKYKIVESPLPVRDYVSTLSVRANAKGGSHITWTGHFKRKSTSDSPPEAENDAAATKLITGVYEGGLANVKKMLDGG